MDILQDKTFWLTLLFRGSRSSSDGCDTQSDEYIDVFKKNNLTAISLPILEFNFKNLDRLSYLVRSLKPNNDEQINGLIITSPRVVEGLLLTSQQLEDHWNEVVNCIDERFVFVVGEKSAHELENKLGLGCDTKSAASGSARALADYIRKFCNTLPESVRLNLVYPKGSLTDDTIEERLRDTQVTLNSVIIYETTVNSFIESDIIKHFKNLNIPEKTDKVNIIHTFFSPSGVVGFRSIDSNWYRDLVQKSLPDKTVQFLYSAIGKTTEDALVRNNFQAFSVAAKPNATSLLEALRNKISTMTSVE